MRVLLLDTAFAAMPIYTYLIETGHEVWVVGNRPMDPLAQKAGDKWLQQDYSKVDQLCEHLREHRIETLVPGCTDVSIDTCLQLALNPHLHDSYETNAILANKAEFRRACACLDLPAPRTVRSEDFPMAGRFICKPVDGFSGRGITVFAGDDLSALNNAVERANQASPSNGSLIETFVEGQLYSCSAFVRDRRLIDIFYVREGASANPYAVDTSYVEHDFDRSCARKLEEGLNQLCSGLGLKDGLLHTQFILSGSDPYIVEVTRRCPGDLYPLLIEYSTGYRYAAKYAASFLGEDFQTSTTERRHVLRHTVTSLTPEHYGGLQFKIARSVRAFFPILPMGQPLLPAQGNRAGILFSEAQGAEQVREDYNSFMEREVYKVAI